MDDAGAPPGHPPRTGPAGRAPPAARLSSGAMGPPPEAAAAHHAAVLHAGRPAPARPGGLPDRLRHGRPVRRNQRRHRTAAGARGVGRGRSSRAGLLRSAGRPRRPAERGSETGDDQYRRLRPRRRSGLRRDQRRRLRRHAQGIRPVDGRPAAGGARPLDRRARPRRLGDPRSPSAPGHAAPGGAGGLSRRLPPGARPADHRRAAPTAAAAPRPRSGGAPRKRNLLRKRRQLQYRPAGDGRTPGRPQSRPDPLHRRRNRGGRQHGLPGPDRGVDGRCGAHAAPRRVTSRGRRNR